MVRDGDQDVCVSVGVFRSITSARPILTCTRIAEMLRRHVVTTFWQVPRQDDVSQVNDVYFPRGAVNFEGTSEVAYSVGHLAGQQVMDALRAHGVVVELHSNTADNYRYATRSSRAVKNMAAARSRLTGGFGPRSIQLDDGVRQHINTTAAHRHMRKSEHRST